MYHQYRLNKSVALQKAQKVNRITLPITIIVMLGAFAFALYPTTASSQTLPFLIGGVAILFVFALVRGYRRGKKKLNLLIDSYIFVVKDGAVIRRIEGYPEIAIPFNQIKQITKYAKGHFSISTADPRIKIHIPDTVEDAAGLETVLQQIQPIVHKRGQVFFVQKRLLLTVLPAVAFIAVAGSDNKWVVGAGSIIALAGIGWFFYYLYGNKAVPGKTKLQLLILGILIFVIMLGKVIIVKWV